MARLSLVVALLGLTGCTSYDCAEHGLFEQSLPEQCGPLGSYGFLYFEDVMVQLLLDGSFEDFQTSESDLSLEYLPVWTVGFLSTHLYEGAVLGEGETLAWCSRTEGAGTGVTTWTAAETTIEILGPSPRTATGGQSWEIRWEVACPTAEMHTTGEDIIELEVQERGWDFELYGVPPDWPEEWQ